MFGCNVVTILPAPVSSGQNVVTAGTDSGKKMEEEPESVNTHSLTRSGQNG